MPKRKATTRGRDRLQQLLALAEALPELAISGEQHLAFRVRGKILAWYLNDHHGDGIVALSCKSTFARQRELVARDPRQYFVPSYSGPKGWVAIRLDLPEVDWGEVAELLVAAYRLQAPGDL